MTLLYLRKKDPLPVACKRAISFILVTLLSISNFTMPLDYNHYTQIVTTAHADTPPIEGPNIALGKTYTLEPNPNYCYSTGASDLTDLTDGVFVPSGSNMWGDQLSVGWLGTPTVIITLDLGSDQPVSAIKYSTVSHAPNGVYWPYNIYVLASMDGNDYYLITDMMKDDPNIPPVPTSGGVCLYKITSCGLDTHARYVRFVVFNSHIHIDEIQIFGGGSGVPGQPYNSVPMPRKDETKPAGIDQYAPLISLLKAQNRLYADIDALRSKAVAADLDINAELDAIKSRFRNFENYYDELKTFKSIIPLPLPAGYDGIHDAIGKIQCDLIKLNAGILRAEGNSGFVLWNANRWDHLDMYTSPPQGAVIQPISLSMMNKERRGSTFNLTNAEDTDKTVTITVNGLKESGNADFIKLYTVGYVDTTGSVLVGDLLQEVPKGAGDYTVNIPAGMTQQIWVEFAPKALSEETHTGTVSVTDGVSTNTINVNLSISHYTFPEKLEL